MNFTTTEITALVGSYLWPLFRIASMVMVAPVSGAESVPSPVRIVAAIALTAALVPLLPTAPAVDPFSWEALLITIQEVLIGIAIGFSFQLIFAAIIMGAQIIAMQMGLGFATMVDPQNGADVPVLAQLYLMLTTLLFLAVDGHLLMFDMIFNSFQVMPIGGAGLDRDAFYALATWGGTLYQLGLWLALPTLAAVLLVNIAFGVMARAAPQLNIFSVGFPMTIIFGFFFAIYTLPVVKSQFEVILQSVIALIERILGG
ncbi:MAG: flagellar biosynthetic protein FliR [Gammaproteobacteria bacterium]|nr:flagellar biosynthetic protein FliR [Gammaproteobacteria bacterium]